MGFGCQEREQGVAQRRCGFRRYHDQIHAVWGLGAQWGEGWGRAWGGGGSEPLSLSDEVCGSVGWAYFEDVPA